MIKLLKSITMKWLGIYYLLKAQHDKEMATIALHHYLNSRRLLTRLETIL